MTSEAEQAQRKAIDDQMRQIANDITKTRDQLHQFESSGSTAQGRDAQKHLEEHQDMQRKHAQSADKYRELGERYLKSLQ